MITPYIQSDLILKTCGPMHRGIQHAYKIDFMLRWYYMFRHDQNIPLITDYILTLSSLIWPNGEETWALHTRIKYACRLPCVLGSIVCWDLLGIWGYGSKLATKYYACKLSYLHICMNMHIYHSNYLHAPPLIYLYHYISPNQLNFHELYSILISWEMEDWIKDTNIKHIRLKYQGAQASLFQYFALIT